MERKRVHIRKARSPWWQLSYILKIRIESVTARWRAVHRVATLVDSRRLPGYVKACYGSTISEGCGAPILNIAKKVVSSAVGPEIHRGRRGKNGQGEGPVLPANDRHPVPRGSSATSGGGETATCPESRGPCPSGADKAACISG